MGNQKMKNRILYVKLNNIKSVKNGCAMFSDLEIANKGDLNDSKSSILGLYGQNGSGKTTLFNCFDLLKGLSLGKQIYSFDEEGNRIQNRFSYLVNSSANEGIIEFGFLIVSDNLPYKVIYKITLESIDFEKEKNVAIREETVDVYKFFDTGERWKYKLAPLCIKYDVDSFKQVYDGANHLKEEQYIKADCQSIDYFSEKKTCRDFGKSFLFSEVNLNYLINHSKAKVQLMGQIIRDLRQQLSFEMFLFEHSREALSGVGLGSLLGTSMSFGKELHGSFYVSLKPFFILENDYLNYRKFIEQINVFISSFIPGFICEIKKTNNFKVVDGKKQVQVLIHRLLNKDNYLPLSEESSGIRKLFFISCALIYIYGNKNGWLIVDELDSGIFEDLLGQILCAFENSGKGQLVFTAHNLVPLERVSPNFVLFTTFNEKDRYIQIKSLSKTNNLRDVYLRALKLGGQKEELASIVDVFEIENALFKAYKAFDKYKDNLNE